MNRILLITHMQIGEALLATAKTTFGDKLPCTVSAIDISQHTNPDSMTRLLESFIHQHTDGVLILTDMFGSTPCNIARALQHHDPNQVRLLSGLNLPMLIRALTYSQMTLSEMTEKAFLGGREGVCVCTDDEKKKVSYDTEDCHPH